MNKTTLHRRIVREKMLQAHIRQENIKNLRYTLLTMGLYLPVAAYRWARQARVASQSRRLVVRLESSVDLEGMGF